MMLPLRAFTYVGAMASLATAIQAAAVFERQAVSINSPSTIRGVQGTPHPLETQSPTTTVTKIVAITSTVSPNPPPDEFTAPVASTFVLTKVQSGHTSFSTITVTLNPELMTAVPHRVPTPHLPNVTQPAEEHSSNNKGAIAGGVLGTSAVIVAAFTVFIWLRRRSPKHWRNRTVGRWQSFDNKNTGSAGAGSIYVGEPVYRARSDIKQVDPDPLPPLHIKDRQPAVDPFVNDPGSPTSPRSRARASSYSGGGHLRTETNSRCFDMELQPATLPVLRS
jgi:hypothetical protein